MVRPDDTAAPPDSPALIEVKVPVSGEVEDPSIIEMRVTTPLVPSARSHDWDGEACSTAMAR